MTWRPVTTGLYIGPSQLPGEVPAMERAQITDVLDLRGEPNNRPPELGPDPSPYVGSHIRYHYLPMLDRGADQPYQVFEDAIEIIKRVIDAGGSILVHCAAGQYRSPAVAYAFLRSRGYAPAEAWAKVLRAQPRANRQYVASAERAVTRRRTEAPPSSAPSPGPTPRTSAPIPSPSFMAPMPRQSTGLLAMLALGLILTRSRS